MLCRESIIPSTASLGAGFATSETDQCPHAKLMPGVDGPGCWARSQTPTRTIVLQLSMPVRFELRAKPVAIMRSRTG